MCVTLLYCSEGSIPKAVAIELLEPGDGKPASYGAEAGFPWWDRTDLTLWAMG